jgi:plastocyanin
MRNRYAFAAIAVITLGAIAALAFACGEEEDQVSQIQPVERTIYMEAVEPKGTTNVAKEPFPGQALPPGGGYILKEPDEKGDWVVETYVWNPRQVVVHEGDTVHLQIIGINGASHEASIEGYVESFTVERGKITTLNFTAERPGVFKILCTTHQPSMTAELVVLPRS